MPGLGSVFLRPGRKMRPRPVVKSQAAILSKPALRQARQQVRLALKPQIKRQLLRRALSREEQIRNAGARAQRIETMRRVDASYNQMFERVAQAVRKNKVTKEQAARKIDELLLQKEITFRRLGLK